MIASAGSEGDFAQRSKWARNSCHSASAGTRYPSLGRSDHRRAGKEADTPTPFGAPTVSNETNKPCRTKPS